MGEVLDGSDVRRHFSTDASIYKIEPQVIVYPRNEQDVRKLARFSWQLAERGRSVPITSRGAGSDLTGASIGEGIVVVFPAHMNRVISMDLKKGHVSVEPGANIAKIQQTLNVQYKFLPATPMSSEYATIGGAVANNSTGPYSEKYGPMKNSVSGLRVVLANGEVIHTKRLNKRELSRKLGLANFEGDIYRAIDAIIMDNQELMLSGKGANWAYDLSAVKQQDGSFDLTPLFVGSQGTLGIVSEVELSSEDFNPQPAAVLAYINGLDNLLGVVAKIKEQQPAAMEMIDQFTLRHITKVAPSALKKTINKKSDFLLILEFDDTNSRTTNRKLKNTKAALDAIDAEYVVGQDDEMRERIWKVRNSIGLILTDGSSKGRPLPAVESASVPLESYSKLYMGAVDLFKKHHIPFMSWGRVGLGQLSTMPKIDLSETSGRQKVLRLMDDYHKMVLKLGGHTSSAHNSGRLRGQYQPFEVGKEAYDIMLAVKQVFDPHNVLNPGVKVNVGRKELVGYMRTSYTLGHHYTHLPRI